MYLRNGDQKTEKKRKCPGQEYYLAHIYLNYICSCWDTSTSSQVSNCDGVVLDNYLDHKFQWPKEGFKCESLAYKVVT